MDWNAISAIGTVIAAFVGVAGIWLNIWEKKKRLDVQFEMIPACKVFICNGSSRTVLITKMTCKVGVHVFYARYFDDGKETTLPAFTTKTIKIDKQAICDSYFQYQMDSLCALNEKVEIVLFDNYGRRYKIDTNMPISFFKE